METLKEPSPQVIEQRVRNRLIEWLEMLVTYEVEPACFDLNAVLNQWEDWNPSPETFPEPVYTPSESEKLKLVAAAWEVLCDATEKRISDEKATLVKPEWKSLVCAGHTALAELQVRGRLSELTEA